MELCCSAGWRLGSHHVIRTHLSGCSDRFSRRVFVHRNQGLAWFTRVQMVADLRSDDEKLTSTQLARLFSHRHIDMTTQHVNGDNPIRLVLFEKAAVLEHEQEKGHWSIATQGNLAVAGDRVMRFGPQPRDGRGKIDELGLVRPAVPGVRPETIRRCHCGSARSQRGSGTKEAQAESLTGCSEVATPRRHRRGFLLFAVESAERVEARTHSEIAPYFVPGQEGASYHDAGIGKRHDFEADRGVRLVIQLRQRSRVASMLGEKDLLGVQGVSVFLSQGRAAHLDQ